MYVSVSLCIKIIFFPSEKEFDNLMYLRKYHSLCFFLGRAEFYGSVVFPLHRLPVCCEVCCEVCCNSSGFLSLKSSGVVEMLACQDNWQK